MVSSFIRTELKIDNSIFSNLVNFFQTSRLQMFSHLPLTPQHMQVIYTITWNILTYAENAPRFDKRTHRNQSWKKVYKVKKVSKSKGLQKSKGLHSELNNHAFVTNSCWDNMCDDDLVKIITTLLTWPSTKET